MYVRRCPQPATPTVYSARSWPPTEHRLQQVAREHVGGDLRAAHLELPASRRDLGGGTLVLGEHLRGTLAAGDQGRADQRNGQIRSSHGVSPFR